MGSRYLTDLADVVRSVGLVVQEEPGWQTRARSSGGYNSGLPNHVMIHHTASGPSSDGQPDVNYMCYSADAKPVANLYLSRSGKVWIMAAGATNTNGSGSDPCGAVANDNMNASTIGIEAGNNGTGEVWPDAQQQAYTKLVKMLCDHYGIAVGRVHSHAEWAPGRKIDPAGPSRWAGSGTWNEDAFRSDVAAGWPGGSPSPGPKPERKWLAMYGLYFNPDTNSYWASDMMTARWLQTNNALNHYMSMLTAFGFNGDPNKAAKISSTDIDAGMLGVVVGRCPWDAGGARDQTALNVLNCLFAYGPAGNIPVYMHLGQARMYAAEAAGVVEGAPASDEPTSLTGSDPPEPDKMKAPKG